MTSIYIVEDDADIRELVIYALKSAGFTVHGFETVNSFFTAMDANIPNLVLLDIMLPDEDGLSALIRIRNDYRYKSMPVIMLTAKGSEYDKVRGLDMGADDYITKPFGITELVSRINAVLRRSKNSENTQNVIISYKNILLESARRTVSVDNEIISLTYKEYELLNYLLLNKGLVLSRDKIMETVWGFGFEGESRTVDVHIKSLRKKLGVGGEHIKTIRNVGYKIGE